MKFLAGLAPVLVTGLCLIAAERGYAGAHIEARHVLMLHPGLDTVWGTYMFGVRNDGDMPERVRGPLALPQETIDFQAQEGLSQEELISGDGEGLMFEKEFPVGLTLISVGFKVPANFGQAALTFVPKLNLGEFSLVTKKDGLTLSSSSDLLGEAANTIVSDQQFIAISAKGPINSGQSLVINVGNVPEGRGRLWLAGAIIAAVLVALSVGMTLKTMSSSRPLEKIEIA